MVVGVVSCEHTHLRISGWRCTHTHAVTRQLSVRHLRSEGGACRHQANISTFLSWASDPQEYECYKSVLNKVKHRVTAEDFLRSPKPQKFNRDFTL